jgi:hypothetical protein
VDATGKLSRRFSNFIDEDSSVIPQAMFSDDSTLTPDQRAARAKRTQDLEAVADVVGSVVDSVVDSVADTAGERPVGDPKATARAAKALRTWKSFKDRVDAERDDVVKAAFKAGMTKTEIHQIAGVSRTKIDDILK